METAARSYDPWGRGSQAWLTQYPSSRHKACPTWRFCNFPICTPCNSPAWRAALQSHNHVRYGIGSANTRRFNASFNSNFRVSEWCCICRGSGRPGDNSAETSPEEDSDKFLDTTPVVNDEQSASSGESQDTNEDDWRAFRARLVVGEQSESVLLDSDDHDKESLRKALCKNWAHALPFPEAGCLLVATEKLDGQPPFERSVILLLRLGTSKPQDGPFGIILNRPIVDISRVSGPIFQESEPITERMAQILKNCRLFYGGPLPADIFLLMRMAEGLSHLEEIMPGVYYGYAHGLQQAADLTSQDKILHGFRFYVGYAGWDFNQLRDEIAEGFWWVAACSPDLIKEVPSDSLWREVLMSMGGEYAEIGKKYQGDGL